MTSWVRSVSWVCDFYADTCHGFAGPTRAYTHTHTHILCLQYFLKCVTTREYGMVMLSVISAVCLSAMQCSNFRKPSPRKCSYIFRISSSYIKVFGSRSRSHDQNSMAMYTVRKCHRCGGRLPSIERQSCLHKNFNAKAWDNTAWTITRIVYNLYFLCHVRCFFILGRPTILRLTTRVLF